MGPVRAWVEAIPRGWIARSATGVFAFRIAQGAIGFVTTLLLARMLGPAGYGAYAVILSAMWLLGTVAALGFPTLLVREIARHVRRSEWGLLRGLLRRSNQLVLAASLALGLLASAAVLGSDVLGVPDTRSAFWLSLAILPLGALISLRQTVMEGLQHVLEARAMAMVLQPLLFGLLVGLAFLAATELTAAGAMALRLGATTITLAVGLLWARRLLPAPVWTSPPVYATRAWLRSVLPLIAIAVTHIVRDQAPVLMLGAMAGQVAAGLFTAVTGITDVIGFVFLAMNAPVAPRMAGLHASGEVEQLQRLATTSARVMAALSLPLAAGLIALGGAVLALFGPGFVEARAALTVLAVVHVGVAVLGSAATVLTMTGHERDAFKGALLTAVLTVGLGAALIPAWGAAGAAVAVGLGRLSGSLALAAFVRTRLGIDPTALGRPRPGQSPGVKR